MADDTKIEWTDATWNPITGCSVVSPGCTNCYAMRLAGTRLADHPSRSGLTRDTKAGPVWTGEVRFNEQWLTQPLSWRRPRDVFVCAHGDLFHEDVPDAWIDRVFAVMALAPQHRFQLLTKRAKRMREYLSGEDRQSRIAARGFFMDGGEFERRWPLPNVWLGVSVEDQARADERIPDLLATPAALRWVSAEPLLGPVDFTRFFHAPLDMARGLHWIVVGGESGPGARPMHPQWARDIRDQCATAGVPYFHKQNGEWIVERARAGGDLGGDMRADRVRHVCVNRENDGHFRAGDLHMRHVGKKRAGRLLDGREHNDMPRGSD